MTEEESELVTPRYLNRELSWLDFNARVLAQAEDPNLPLLERLKFCAIYATNLDEFFMVRVAGLKDQVAGGVTRTPPDGLSPLAQLGEIRKVVDAQTERLQRVRHDVLIPALGEEGIHLCNWDDLSLSDQKRATGIFEDRVFPVLTPLAVDPGHPFPYISSLSLNLAVLVVDPENGQHHFARVKVPPSLPRFISLPDHRFVAVEQVITAHLDYMFPGMEVAGGWSFRVTRNADLTLDEDADDLLEAVELELRRRRFGRAIRLEISQDMPSEVRQLLQRELDLDEEDIFSQRGRLDASSYWQLQSLDRSDLKVPLTPGIAPRRLRDLEGSRDLFRRVSSGDIFVHHPYESFGASVTEFLRLASRDPDVLAIKITLYRTSGDSPIIDALIRAAERGKQVAALVELKARFDEEANITWAKRLEEAGVHVVYGLVGLKIHAKTVLVVRDEPDGLRQYCHIGTGNYNSKTARIYEDIGVLTADPGVGEDLTQLFNFLTGYGRDVDYQRLLVAPHSLRPSLEELIETETRAPLGKGRIVLKMNSLVDARIIDRLYEASQAGVRIDLIVRGICCLIPGVPGLSNNIRVRSLVGRNLEHSRLYYFAHGGLIDEEISETTEDDVTIDSGATVGVGTDIAGDRTEAEATLGAGFVVTDGSEPKDESTDIESTDLERFYFGSADLMPRNLDRRVEVLLRIDDPKVQERLHELIRINLEDTALAWEMDAEGTYHRVGGEICAHDEFERLASERSVPKTEKVISSAAPSSRLRQFLPRRRPNP